MARKNRPSKKAAKKPQSDNSALTKLLETPEGAWKSARLLAARVSGYCAAPVNTLIPIFQDGHEGHSGASVPTMAVDKYYRCYVNLGFVEELMKEAEAVTKHTPCEQCGATEHHKLAYVAGVIFHESQHPLREHHARADKYSVQNAKVWNLGTDAEINDDTLELFDIQARASGNMRICLPKGVILPKFLRDGTGDLTKELASENITLNPASYKFVDNDMAESYYVQLMNLRSELKQQQPQQQGQQPGQGNSGGQGDPSQQPSAGESLKNQLLGNSGGQDCGSGAHGEARDYEQGAPTAKAPGVSEGENKAIQRQVAQKIREHAATRGDVPAGMKMWADDVLEPPKVDWRKVLQRHVRKAVNRAWGHKRRSWHALGRSSAATGFRVLFPNHYTPQPQVGIVLDTSGSMGSGPGSPLHEAYVEIQGICKKLQAQLHFCSVDSAAGKIQKITNLKQATITGGGGTDMRVGVEAFENAKERIDVVVVLTDGYTPWPDSKPKKFDLIAAVTGDNREEASFPDWLPTVFVELED